MNTVISPKISVIIINHNGKEFLNRCFSSLLSTEYENFEIIFVDNASTDESIEFVVNKFKDNRIAIIQNEKNFGVPGGRNIGFSKANGEYIVFLDNDTEVEAQWLKELIKVFQSDSLIAVAQSKLLKMDKKDKFDHAGDLFTPFGFLYERSANSIDEGQFDRIEDILSAKGAATMIKSSAFKELGQYDDSYYMYLEETDFCFRVWLAGYKVVFVFSSIVWHAFETPLKDRKKYYSNYVVRYYGCRNYISTLLKNLSLFNVVRIVPIHIFCWIFLSLFFMMKGLFKDSYWIFKGILWNFSNFPKILKKRLFVQKKLRKVRDRDFLNKLMVYQGFNYYLKKAFCYLSD